MTWSKRVPPCGSSRRLEAREFIHVSFTNTLESFYISFRLCCYLFLAGSVLVKKLLIFSISSVLSSSVISSCCSPWEKACVLQALSLYLSTSWTILCLLLIQIPLILILVLISIMIWCPPLHPMSSRAATRRT